MIVNLGKLHAKQTQAFNSKATEILYGGAAGGGKSHLMRVIAIVLSLEVAGLQTYLFRRKSKDLEKNHLEGPKGLRAILSPLINSKRVEIVKGEIRFKNGSKIYLCHCNHTRDIYNYQGPEIHLLLIDELTHFTEEMYTFLRSRVRCVGLNIPEKYKLKLPLIVAGSNPGNIGHAWVRDTFVKYAKPFSINKTPEDEGGMLRQFIPAQLEDNPSMMQDDPSYEGRLSGLGSKALVEAMRYGNWDIVAGAFFDWRQELVLKPFYIPAHWPRFFSYDHGRSSPFSCGWYTVADGTVNYIPRGSLIKYREWYGCGETKAKGLKLNPNQIAQGIIEREAENEHISTRIADPSIFGKQGTKSVAREFAENGIHFTRANNDRLAGWQQIHQRIAGHYSTNIPELYFFDNCVASIDLLPALPRCERNIEDLDTKSVDHVADELRYQCMYHSYVVDVKEDEEIKCVRVNEYSSATYADLDLELIL